MLLFKSFLALIGLSLLLAEEEAQNLAYDTDNALYNGPVRDLFKGDFFGRLRKKKPIYDNPPPFRAPSYKPQDRPVTDEFYVPDEKLCLVGKSLAYNVISSPIGALNSPKAKYAIRDIIGVMDGETCKSACDVNSECSFAVVEKQFRKCILFSSKASYFLTPTDSACLYVKNVSEPLYMFNHKSLASSLINYWPIVNFQKDDLIGQAHMFNCENASISQDRFQNPDSALDLRNGYCQLPIGAYFNNPKGFSISHSILIRENLVKLDSFFEFTKNPRDDDTEDFWIVSSPGLSSDFLNHKKQQVINVTEAIVPLYTWVHIGFVSDGYSASLYYNGKIIGSRKGIFWSPVVFLENYVGKNPFFDIYTIDALFDEFRIYGTPLSPSQIYEDSQIGSYLHRVY